MSAIIVEDALKKYDRRLYNQKLRDETVNKDSVERYRQQEEFVDAGRRNLKRWNMWRNILYAGITFLVFLGFLFVGAATDPNPAHLQHI